MMPDRVRPHRGRAFHAPRGPQAPSLPREPAPRAPARNGEPIARATHGEDAGPQAEGAPPREDRAG
jgi:hypothetical protein